MFICVFHLFSTDVVLKKQLKVGTTDIYGVKRG